LKIAIEKIVVRSREQQLGQAAEIKFQRLFVEGYSCKSEEVVLEIIQIPGDGLAIKARARIANLVIEVAARHNLKARQLGDHLAIGSDDLGADGVTRTIGAEKFEQRVSPRSSSR